MFTWKILVIILQVINFSSGYPVDLEDVPTTANTIGIAAVLVGFLLSLILAVFACACCRERSDGFKEFTNTGSLTNVGFTNALATEVSIFPPPGTIGDGNSSARQSPTVSPVQVTVNTEYQQPSRPAAFSSTVHDISDWFVDPDANFPRQQLFYQKEIGKGWFGKVVEGEARGAKVVVRILREDATNEEKAYFLHEARPYRDLVHKNVTKLFGRCLQYEPYLLLFELYNNGDLKSFLRTNETSKSTLNEQGISLKMMADVCEGVKFMNDNGFIHTDLAARNCLVTSDLTVKIGDYGTSVDLYKNEYYIAGNVAVPIRWCAPESIHCTSTTIETKQVTAPANVWSLAVVLWEIAEFGKLPYFDLSDDQVIVRVHGEEKYRLPQPDCPYGHYLYNIMQICWRSENRATIDQVLSMLYYLKTNPFQESDFDSRWKKLKPNTVPIVDNHTPIHSPRHTELAQRPHLQTKSEFDSGVDLEIKPTDDNSCKTSSPMTISPQLSVTSEDIFQSTRKKSPSLTNLQGSLEDVSSQFDSWLQGVETKTDEDRTFARNISEAIKNLDETLALEKTSSSSSRDSSLECQNKPLLEFNIGAESGPSERKSESSSDTEEETWRHRIERGEFTEKVKEKSKSVTDLMVLTHIDSEESENDSLPSLTRQYSLKRNGSKGGTTYTSIGFGSEGNIRNAVLSEELQEKLKSLTLWKTEEQPFLGKRTSDTNSKKNTDQLFLGKPTTETSIQKPENTTFLENPAQKISTEEENIVSDSSSIDLYHNKQHEHKSTELFLENEILANSNMENIFLENEIVNNDPPFLDMTLSSNNSTTISKCVRGVNMYSGDETLSENNMEIVNKSSNVNNDISTVSINNAATLDTVNKECTEDVEEFVKNTISNKTSENENVELNITELKDTKCEKLESVSSQEMNNLPEIVITESEIEQLEDDKETEISFDFKPRKFIFVCKDSANGEERETCSPPSDLDLVECDFFNSEENLLTFDIKPESSVILGSCEEHTLDYFRGLKTTFSPSEQYSDEESDVKESSSTKEDTVRQLTDTNDECVSPSRDDSTAHATDDCISPLKDDGLKHIYDLLLEDGPVLDETDVLDSSSPIGSQSEKPCEETASTDNLTVDIVCTKDVTGTESNSTMSCNLVCNNDLQTENLASVSNSNESSKNSEINGVICDAFIKEELKLYSIDDQLTVKSESSNDHLLEISNCKDLMNKNLCLENSSSSCPILEDDFNKEDEKVIQKLAQESPADVLLIKDEVNSEHINISIPDLFECNNEYVNSDKQSSCKPAPQNQNENTKNSKSANTNKVSKSKSLESVLCSKNEIDNMKFLSNTSISEYVPIFSLSEMVPEDLFAKQSINYDSYYSVDSGHGSDRCADQDKQMDDLKNRLEDVMKYGDDYQLHSSEDEYGGKLLTPDDERSSDSGFRDKGSLSESVEDTCDEKYNLEDIDAELEDFSALKTAEKEDGKYYEQFTATENEPLPQIQNVEGWFLHPKVESSDIEPKNGWLPLSTEGDEKHNLTIDDEFVTAIRKELKEKLPCAMQTQKTEEDNSPEQEFVDPNVQFTYPAQLSPILEEQESNQSSLLVDDVSPVLIIPPPEIPTEPYKVEISEISEGTLISEKEDAIMENIESEKDELITPDKFAIDDDVLIVDTETNEVTLIESPKPQANLSFILPKKAGENIMDDDSTGINSETYVLSPDNAPLTPDISVGSNTLSSPEHGNISGLCISPSSIRSDLFDSGPPSLPFDLGQSLEDVEEIAFSKPNNETTEILQDLIDAGIVNKEDIIEQEEVTKNNDISIIENNVSQECENDKNYEACVSKELITSDLLEKSSDEITNTVAKFLEAEIKEGAIINAMLDSSDKPGTSDISSPAKIVEEAENSADTPPVIIVEEEKEVKKTDAEIQNVDAEIQNADAEIQNADAEIPVLEKQDNDSIVQNDVVDRLIDELPKSEDLMGKEKPHCSVEQNRWLQELLLSSSIKKDKIDPFDDKLSVTQNWPSSDELLSPTSINEGKLNGIIPRPGNITSTLALMSPDLSSTDSRSHSLLSSFASTPSDDQKQFDTESTSKVSAPSSLSLSSAIINVPMPSPEDADKGWRPTICQLMELTDQAEGEEMTTSFIEPDENGIYTPDWESDTSDEQSSSSGEFVWKEGDRDDIVKDVTTDTTNLLQEPIKMERIDEEEESAVESDNSSEGSCTEFIPSTWNPLATPSKSAIRNPESPVKKEKKKVIFKKEKYQCIYEYPREASDEEDSPDTWQTPAVTFDYSPFEDWEFGDNEVGANNAEGDSDSEEQRKPKRNQDFDFYRLDYNIGPHLITDDGEFFISSSSRMLDWCGGGADEGDSEFFPGRDSLEFSPCASDLTPLNLGELRHTKDSLRLELPLLSRTAVDQQSQQQQQQQQQPQLLQQEDTNLTVDSGIDTASPIANKMLPIPQSNLTVDTTNTTTAATTTSTTTHLSCAQQSAREDKGEAALLDDQQPAHTSNIK